MKIITKLLAVGCLGLALSAQAALVNLSTGVGNWTVQQILPAGEATAPIPAVDAYNPPPGTFPIVNPYWLPNDLDSQWVTTSRSGEIDISPLDYNRTYVYSLNFTLGSMERYTLRWMSDNTSSMMLDSTPLGSTGSVSEFNIWAGTQTLTLGPGSYTLALTVINQGDNTGGPNPTGARVEFMPVPEPATIAAGALLLLPFAASTLRRFRKS